MNVKKIEEVKKKKVVISIRLGTRNSTHVLEQTTPVKVIWAFDKCVFFDGKYLREETYQHFCQMESQNNVSCETFNCWTKCNRIIKLNIIYS